MSCENLTTDDNLQHGNRFVRECGVYDNRIGHVVPAAGDMLDAIYFIFPKSLLSHLKYAKLEGRDGIDWDFLTIKDIHVIGEVERSNYVGLRETSVVVHPQFFGRRNMNYLSSLRCYGEAIHAGLIFDENVLEDDDFKIAFQFQNFQDIWFRNMLSAKTCTEPHYEPVVSCGIPDILIFMNGMMARHSCKQKLSDELETELRNNPIPVNGIPTKKYFDPYSIPFYDESNAKRIVDEFDSYVPRSYRMRVVQQRKYLNK